MGYNGNNESSLLLVQSFFFLSSVVQSSMAITIEAQDRVSLHIIENQKKKKRRRLLPSLPNQKNAVGCSHYYSAFQFTCNPTGNRKKITCLHFLPTCHFSCETESWVFPRTLKKLHTHLLLNVNRIWVPNCLYLL